MDPTTELLLALAKALGFTSVAAVAVWIPLIVLLANRIARVIPDNATGGLKYLRVFFAVLGINVRNNTGVTPVVDTQGKLIQRSEAEPGVEIDGTVKVEEPAPVIQDMFSSGAAALAKQANEDSTHVEG